MGNKPSNQSPSSTQATSLLSRTPSRLGQRVLRGPHCVWDNEDGDAGSVGTLIAVEHPSADDAALSVVWVAWDNGEIEMYGTSRTGPWDLRLYDNGPAGIYFPDVTCDACLKTDIGGTRWKCSECLEYELCHTCYMEDMHSTEHAFLRFDAPDATGTKVDARMGSLKLNVRGIFEGAKVVRGPHWKERDGADYHGSVGTVLRVRDTVNGTVRSTAHVQWSRGICRTYSVGHGGDVALKYVQCAEGYPIYVNHMPVIGPMQLQDDCGSEFFMGARVGVTLDVATFRLLQLEHGNWNPKLAKVINKIGVVQDVTATGEVRVLFGFGTRWNITPAALLKVPTFSVDDTVRIVKDLPTVDSLEENDDNLAEDDDSLEEDDDSLPFEERTEVHGKTGTVTEVCRSQDIRVNIDGCDFIFNPFSLVLVSKQSTDAELSHIGTDVEPSSHSDAQKSLEARLRDLQLANKCAICMDNQRNVLFLCGHGCCDDCSQNLHLCHICRNPITMKIPIL